MTKARRAILAIPVLLAACTTATSPSPAAPTTPAATPSTGTATATDAPTPVASEPAGSPAPSPEVSATPGASLSDDLASLLPTEIAGNEMTIEPASDSANGFMILWNDEQVAQDLLDALGASSSDIDIVSSYPTGDTFPERVFVDAYRVAGADGVALRDGFVENYRTFYEQYSPVAVTTETIGGKEVVVLSPQTDQAEPQHFYAVGDIVFVVSGNPFEWIEDAFAQLP